LLKTIKQSSIDILLKNYNQYFKNFLQCIKANYLPQVEFPKIDLRESDLKRFEGIDTGIYTKRLSFEVIGKFLTEFLNAKISNGYLSEAIVRDVFKQYALFCYQNLILSKEGRKVQGSLEETFNLRYSSQVKSL